MEERIDEIQEIERAQEQEKIAAAKQELEDRIAEHKEITAHFEREFRRTGYIPKWPNYNAVRQFKSVRRAIRRGHMDLFSGMVYPNRPFSNKKATKGREMNELKKAIYGQLHKRAV